jgi:6-methylsalicylic acid synthase
MAGDQAGQARDEAARGSSGAAGEAVAIIGMSCRFAPDLSSPGALWSYLLQGGSKVTEMPARRWEPYESASPEATSILRRATRKGSYLADIEGFDAEFFQITPREAEFLDPQQRILLELAWEALCDAGVPGLSLANTEAGVFVSANSNDYGRRLLEDISRTGAWAVNGTTYYGMANRISYFLDLRGPSIAVDAACAGSLAALHVARQSLLLGETPVAIVGGINIMASPALVVALDAAGATAPDGRSKAFDVSANGYGRGEGAAVMVLKRLSDARRDGDPVRALILGSGVFQDGRSDGMMAPRSSAQEHMLREVYQRSGVSPAAVGYVEAHGTGTQLGDSAETRALGAVLGAARAAGDPLPFGTLKPNIGHVEAASGIAGVMKAVLAMEHSVIPASLHEQENPALDLGRSGLRLVARPTPWPANGSPRIAGVSSYGVGGTIAHLILQEAPVTWPGPRPAPAAEPASGAGRPVLVPLSAATQQGLRALADDTAQWVRGNPDVPLTSIAYTLARRRSHLTWRCAVVATGHDGLADALSGIADDQRSPAAAAGRAAAPADPVWIFSGHGAQWSGMGQELLRDEPVFAQTIGALQPVFAAELGWTPRQLIEAGGPWTVTRVQAMTFAMQVALAQTWRAWGLRPAAVIGHSVGEIAAAVVAGALDLEDGARFSCRRAAALEAVAGRGAMALVGLPFAEAERLLAGRSDVVAAISASTASTVVSGDADGVDALVEQLRAEGTEARKVNTDVAFHSPHVDEVLAVVGAAARRMSARRPDITIYSTATDDPRSTMPREGTYWETNLRAPVRFAQAVQAALDDGERLFIEVSSHPIVAHSVTETVHAAGVTDAVVCGTLRRGHPEIESMLTSLARLHCAGAQVDFPIEGGLVPAPGVRWQHRPYWIFPDTAVDGSGRGHDPDTHTLLGGVTTVSGAPAQRVWETHLDLSNRPYVQDHKVVGVETVPASVVINSFVAAATLPGGTSAGLTDIVLRTPLAATPPRVVQVVLDGDRARLASRVRREDSDGESGQEQEWITHATASVVAEPVVGSRPMEPAAAIRARCPDQWTWARVDGIFRNMGVEGYTFPWVVEELRRNDVEQLAIVTIDHQPKLHPSSWTAVIDGALTVSGVLVTKENSSVLRTSSHLASIAFRGDPPARIVVHTTRSAAAPDTTIDVLVADESGTVICEATGLRFTQVQDRPGGVAAPRQLVHELTWAPAELPAGETPPALTGPVLLLGDDAVTVPLQLALERLGARCRRLATAADLPDPVGGVLAVSPPQRLPGESAEQAAERCSLALLDAEQELGRRLTPGARSPRLWCLTRGVRGVEGEDALAHAPLWGISRIIAGERPDLWGGVVDLAGDLPPADAADLLLRLWGGSDTAEDVVSLTAHGAAVARLERISRETGTETLRCRPDGSYLITGGLGGIGLEVARYLVERGARRLVLMGRRGLPPRAEWAAAQDPATRERIDAVLELEALGATVRILAVDVSDAAAVTAALGPSAFDLPPIKGIIHLAGAVSDARVDLTESAGLHATFTPKAAGAMVLHRLFPPGSLDFFVLFSSCGQLARLTGQASYAAANSFMDALAALRHASGHAETRSLAWAQWRGIGMGETTAGTTILEAEARGLGGISAGEAFRAWEFADRFAAPYQVIFRLLPEHSLRVFAELTELNEEAEATALTTVVDWSALSGAELGARVLAEVHEQVAAELNLSVSDVDIYRPLVEMGVDSVLIVGLRVRLHRRFGIDLPPTILWSSPTVHALAEFLADELSPDTAEPSPESAHVG